MPDHQDATVWLANVMTLHAALRHWPILISVSSDQPALTFTGVMNVKKKQIRGPTISSDRWTMDRGLRG